MELLKLFELPGVDGDRTVILDPTPGEPLKNFYGGQCICPSGNILLVSDASNGDCESMHCEHGYEGDCVKSEGDWSHKAGYCSINPRGIIDSILQRKSIDIRSEFQLMLPGKTTPYQIIFECALQEMKLFFCGKFVEFSGERKVWVVGRKNPPNSGTPDSGIVSARIYHNSVVCVQHDIESALLAWKSAKGLIVWKNNNIVIELDEYCSKSCQNCRPNKKARVLKFDLTSKMSLVHKGAVKPTPPPAGSPQPDDTSRETLHFLTEGDLFIGYISNPTMGPDAGNFLFGKIFSNSMIRGMFTAASTQSEDQRSGVFTAQSEYFQNWHTVTFFLMSTGKQTRHIIFWDDRMTLGLAKHSTGSHANIEYSMNLILDG